MVVAKAQLGLSRQVVGSCLKSIGTGRCVGAADRRKEVRQRGKIIAQASNLGNNSKFSRHNTRPLIWCGGESSWTASICLENGTAARPTCRRSRTWQRCGRFA